MFVTGLFFQRHVVRCPLVALSLCPLLPPLLLCMLDMCSVWVWCVSLFVVVCVVVCSCVCVVVVVVLETL